MNQTHIALNEAYGKWFEFVVRVDGKDTYPALHAALNELRPQYRKQQERFAVFTEKRAMGLKEWEAREVERVEARKKARAAPERDWGMNAKTPTAGTPVDGEMCMT